MEEKSGCLAIIFKIFDNLTSGKSTETNNNEYPYRKQKTFLSAAERSFCGVLALATKDRYVVCCKVRLADIICVQNSTPSRQSFFNKIKSKHVDFICCDPSTMDIVFAVELDDSSHQSKKVIERDQFVNGAMSAAKVPLVRFKAKKAYSADEISESIRQNI